MEIGDVPIREAFTLSVMDVARIIINYTLVLVNHCNFVDARVRTAVPIHGSN